MAPIPGEIEGRPVVVIRSGRRRRTISLSVEDQAIVLRAPRRVTGDFLEHFFASRLPWVRRRLCQRVHRHAVPKEQVSTCRRTAGRLVRERVAALAPFLGIAPAGISITSARKRWGSCSAGNRLNFPWRIMFLPPEIVDYIVVHELAHIREKNHGPAFWQIVKRQLPDYARHLAWLRNNLIHLTIT